jgi:tetratricopeptide (TPR) repeat protein
MIVPFLTLCMVLAALTGVPAARAQQDPEGPWKNQIILGLRAAGAKDYPKAEQAFLKALQEAQHFGAEDSRVGTTLNSLGLVYRAEKKYSEAEAAYRRALAIMETLYGETMGTANLNFNIASVMFDAGHQADALPNLRRTLAIYEKLLGPTSLKVASAVCMEGDAYRVMKRYPESEEQLHRCADIREKDGGILENGELADALHGLALTYIAEGKFSAAEPRLRLAEKIREKTLGITSPLLAQTMDDHVAVLRHLSRFKEAESLEAIATAIRRK